MSAYRKITVITKFNPTQVGYLDFQYRVSALVKAGILDVVISNNPQAKKELHINDDKFVLIPGGVGGIHVQWKYFYDVRKYCMKNNKKNILLLSSSLAPLAAMLKHSRTALYWNEHPSHLVGQGKGGMLRRLLHKIIKKYTQRQFYKGAKNSSCVMPIGEHHMQDLILHRCAPSLIKMIYMGVDKSFGQVVKHKADSEHLRLIYTGSVKKDRGRDIMLEAISLLKSRDRFVHLTIIGASDFEMAICTETCKALQISDRVTIIGRVPGRDIPNYLKQADMGICIWADKPYWRFNPPTKLFEYLEAGLPVLANNVRTHTQYINDCGNGLICEYDSNDMANVINKIIMNPSLLAQMKSNVVNECGRYLWNNIEPKFINIINQTFQ